MKKEMLINVSQPEECRIAIIEDGVLEELYVERTSQESYVGNIYKGRIVNIEPSIQAAFVDFGIGRNGFLHVSDVEPAYYRDLEFGRSDSGGRGQRRGGRGRDRGRGEFDRDFSRGDNRRSDRSGGRSRSAPAPDPIPDDLPLEDEPFIAIPHDERSTTNDLGNPDLAAPLDDVALGEPEVSGDISPEPQEGQADPSEKKGRRRRGRGRGRRRGRGEADEASAGSDESALGDNPLEPADEAAPAPEEIPPPRPMDSAERRTSDDDDLLFFPRSSPAPADQPAPLPRQEVPEPELPTPSADAQGGFKEDFCASEATEALPRFDDQFSKQEDSDPPELEERFSANLDMEDDDVDDYGDRAEADGEEFSGHSSRQNDRRGGRRGGERRGNGGGRRGGPGGRHPFGRPKPLIQDIFKRGQEVLVQVIKEGIGTKGPTLSTYISIAGRYLVLMPGLNRIGVSRKIADDEQRRRLREIMSELEPPRGLGFIIRTAGVDRNKKDLQRDLAYLSRLWKVIAGRIRRVKSPCEIYKESDMITRTIRDTFTNEIDTIWVDETTAFDHAREFLQIVMPRYASRIKKYEDSVPLFHKYSIEDEIGRIQKRHVPLPNGGSLVIDQTEALVAIDVNSGNFRADNQNAEETAYRMNLIAAKEIARQLRLRDLGGVIVNDFIDMREDKHRRDVERALRDAVKRDRARSKILKISAFGLIEMTRQRIRPSLKRSVYQDCEHCRGTGQVKTCESMSIDVMRMLQLAAHRPNVHRIEIHVAQDVANYLLNKKRIDIARLEETRVILVNIIGWSMPPNEGPEGGRRPGGPLPLPHPSGGVPPEMLQFICYDNNNPPNVVHTFPTPDPIRPGRR